MRLRRTQTLAVHTVAQKQDCCLHINWKAHTACDFVGAEVIAKLHFHAPRHIRHIAA